MLQLIKTVFKSAVTAIIAVIAAATIEWEGTRLTRHAEKIVDLVRDSRTLKTLQQETSEKAGTLIRDAREGAATLEKLREQHQGLASESAKKAAEAAEIVEDFDRISKENQKQLRELIEEKTGN